MKGAVHLSFPCGRCLSCRLNHASDWANRIMGELRYHEKSSFVTLTYNDEHLPEGSNLCYRHCQLFFKKLRKACGIKIRFFLSGEYGTKNGRPHYHAIIFGLGPSDIRLFEDAWTGGKEEVSGSRGFVSAFPVSHEAAKYVAKYTTKKLLGESASWYKEAGVVPEKSLSSRRPGIGANFVCEFGHEFSARGYLYSDRGTKQRIPRYYKKRLLDINPLASERLSSLTDDYLLKKNSDSREQIVRFGYAKVDGMKLLAEEAAKNNSKGKESLKRRKL